MMNRQNDGERKREQETWHRACRATRIPDRRLAPGLSLANLQISNRAEGQKPEDRNHQRENRKNDESASQTRKGGIVAHHLYRSVPKEEDCLSGVSQPSVEGIRDLSLRDGWKASNESLTQSVSRPRGREPERHRAAKECEWIDVIHACVCRTLKPRVARHELPWDFGPEIPPNPERVASRPGDATLSGLGPFRAIYPG